MADTTSKDAQILVDSLKDVSQVMFSTMERLENTMSKFEASVAQVRKGFEGIGTDAKKTVSYVDSWRSSLQDIQKLSERIRSRGLFRKDMTLQEAKKALTEIMDLAKRVSNEPDYGRKNINKARAVLGETEDLLKRIERQAAKAAGNWGTPLRDVGNFSKAVRGMGFDIETVTEKMKQQGGAVSTVLRLFDQYAGKAGVYARIGEAFEARRKRETERRVEFQRRAAVPANAVNRLVAGLQFDEKGRIDLEYLKGLRGSERRNLIQAAREVTQLGKASPDKLEEYVTRLGGGQKAARGVGDVAGMIAATRKGAAIGVTPEAAGGLEAGAAGAGGLEGVMTSPYTALAAGIAIAIQKLFDAWTVRNKEIFQKIGTGGIFAGNQTAISAFQNIRNNLMPGILSAYGMTYDKNLAIAGAITKFGINVSELSDVGNTLHRNIVGLPPGVGGAEMRGRGIGYTAYGVAKLTGLDEVQTTERILKLMMQYHLSLESSDDFFQRLIKDTQAAGLTTVKYLEILDGVTEQFDRLGRGINTVTTILRQLGQTGTRSSEEVQAALKAMMGESVKSPEIRAFLAMQGYQTPEIAQGMVPEAQAQVRLQAEEITKAFKATGAVSDEDLQRIAELGSPNVQHAQEALKRAMYLSADLPDSVSKTLKEPLQGMLNEQQANIDRLVGAQQFVGGGPEGALKWAFPIAPLTPFQRTQDQLMAFATALSQTGIGAEGGVRATPAAAWAQMMKTPEVLQQLNPVLLTKLLELLQATPEQLLTMIGEQTPNARMAARRLMGMGGRKATIAEYEEAARIMGRGLRGEEAKRFILGEAKTEKEKGARLDELSDYFSQSLELQSRTSNIASATNEEMREEAKRHDEDAQRQKEMMAATSMRSTADIFAQAFERLFNEVLKVITWIANHMTWTKPFITNEDFQKMREKVGTEETPGGVAADLAEAELEKQHAEDIWGAEHQRLAIIENKEGLHSGEYAKQVLVERQAYNNLRKAKRAVEEGSLLEELAKPSATPEEMARFYSILPDFQKIVSSLAGIGYDWKPEEAVAPGAQTGVIAGGEAARQAGEAAGMEQQRVSSAIVVAPTNIAMGVGLNISAPSGGLGANETSASTSNAAADSLRKLMQRPGSGYDWRKLAPNRP